MTKDQATAAILRRRAWAGIMHYIKDLGGEPLEEATILASVRLDDCDGGLVHYLGEIDPEEAFIGLEVEAVFKDPAEREGSILDIAYFRPMAD